MNGVINGKNYNASALEPISILQPTYVGCTVDNRGLYSPRMCDEDNIPFQHTKGNRVSQVFNGYPS